jgi:two-component system cell cycle sensor histidine kinase/response regulator CckA
LDSVKAKNSIVHDDVREALQAFSARLAHDFNNLLTPLVAYPGMISGELPADGKALRLLRALESAAEGAVAVTRRLGDLSGVLRTKKRSFDLGVAVDVVLSELKMLPAAAGVHIEKSHAPGLVVNMSQSALSLAVDELCRNALEALAGRGTLAVRVDRQSYEMPFETVDGLAPSGTYVVVEIEDDGIGMSGALLKNALEPFYAGFGGGKRCGGGLGLSITYCALRENGASLLLESEEGRGTLAAILIPEENVRTSVTEEAAVKTMEALGGVKHGLIPQVLVVDDEPSIVNLFKLILENYIHGVTVDKASNGAEALAMFKTKRYDVIVMDLHMPVMDGQTAFIEIENVCQNNGWAMPSVVFCTGYAPRDVVKRAISEGDQHTLLNKPVRSEILVKAVQARLDAGS